VEGEEGCYKLNNTCHSVDVVILMQGRKLYMDYHLALIWSCWLVCVLICRKLCIVCSVMHCFAYLGLRLRYVTMQLAWRSDDVWWRFCDEM